MPLGLPEGSVRAILALATIGVALWAELTHNGTDFTRTLAGAAFGYYFAARSTSSAPESVQYQPLFDPTAPDEAEPRVIVPGRDDSAV